MREVAALAGVSLKTVSRVVNREPNVSPPVRERVERAVAKLDYRHNLTASSLRKAHGRTGTIGALVQDISNSFSAGLLRAIEDAARSRSLALLAGSLDEDPEREVTLVHDLVQRRVDALILMPCTDRQDYLASETRAGLPIVFIDRPSTGIDCDSVVIDNVLGARMATQHLIDHGHRRIAMVGDLSYIYTARGRVRGFQEAHAANGLTPDPALLVSGVRDVSQATTAVLALLALADPPTAIFASRNNVAIGTLQALAQRGMRHTVAVVGFDDFALADLVQPALTVIQQDLRSIGATATDLLFQRLDGGRAAPQQVVQAPTLVVRGSGEIPPTRG